MNVVIETLVKAWATLILGKRRTIEEVPELYNFGGTDYNLRELVELEIAERIVAAM